LFSAAAVLSAPREVIRRVVFSVLTISSCVEKNQLGVYSSPPPPPTTNPGGASRTEGN